MNYKEVAKLIEDRQIEASKKDIAKKGLAIIEFLGYDLIDQDGGCSSDVMSFNCSQPYRMETVEYVYGELPTQDTTPGIVGRYFDGLSSGVNLQISHKNENFQINFNGNIVYKEQAGQIEGYAPSEDWESRLNSLYVLALKKAKLKESIAAADEVEASDSKSQKILDYLRSFWGLK